MIFGRAWIETESGLFPLAVDTRLGPRCRDRKCPDLKRYPCHMHDGALCYADPDLEGDPT